MLVSVVVTSYNYQKYIKDTIISVLNQTFKDWEMIVIDDASTDASVKIIQELTKNDSRVKLIQNSENIGLKNSIKKALKEASGEWIAFLESDDLWREDYLEKKTALINVAGISGSYLMMLNYSAIQFTKHFQKLKENSRAACSTHLELATLF